MEERSCFVCCFEYSLPSRTPYTLQCCKITLCGNCLQNIIDKNEMCPHCRKTPIDEFSLNIVIEESLKFEQYGDVLCEQCSADPIQIAVKVCFPCGLICNQCYISHKRMKSFEKHEISSIPVQKWSMKLDEMFKSSLSCEKHNDKTTESYCKTCQQAVCGDCIAEFHSKCIVSSIDDECHESILCIERELKEIDVEKIAEKCLETMKSQKVRVGNIHSEMKALQSHCEQMLKANFEAVRKEFQEKTKTLIDDYEGREKRLGKTKRTHENLCRFVEEVGSMQNKRGVLKELSQVRKQIEFLHREIKEVDTIEQIDYLAWIKDIFSGLQLAANKDALVDYALQVAESCDGFPSILDILRQYRSLNLEKAQRLEGNNAKKKYIQ